jgi:YHS domain-containing protein
MLRMNLLLAGLATLALAVGLSGCAGAKKADTKSNAAKPGAATQATQNSPDANASGEQAGGEHAGGQYAEQLAKLSPEDRALAEKQQVCPVSGEPLGAMGVPYKVEVKGRTVLLCCPGCEEKIKADPDKYLAKLDKK